jgi:hypothetical protein
MAEFIEYPKALYATEDQGGPYLVANNKDEEDQLRKQGFKMLAEWWAQPAVEKKPKKAADVE